MGSEVKKWKNDWNLVISSYMFVYFNCYKCNAEYKYINNIA